MFLNVDMWMLALMRLVSSACTCVLVAYKTIVLADEPGSLIQLADSKGPFDRSPE